MVKLDILGTVFSFHTQFSV